MTDADDAPFYETYCMECGGGEVDGPVVVEQTELDNRQTNPTMMPSADRRTDFECTACDQYETVETGTLPETNADHFGSRKYSENPNECRIDEKTVLFRDIDVRVVESMYIDRDGAATSRTRNVHVHAVNPPTFTEDSAHHVQISGFVDEDMMLGDIRYHDDTFRTLKFFRGLDDGPIESAKRLGPDNAE